MAKTARNFFQTYIFIFSISYLIQLCIKVIKACAMGSRFMYGYTPQEGQGSQPCITNTVLEIV